VASGNDIPYQLRPNKFIDRQIFLDLLMQVCALKGPSNYLYISMGGKHLVDQEAVYRRIGIKNSFSFDNEEWVVQRQQKNTPHDKVICQALHSSALPGNIDLLMSVFDDTNNFIAWLDYTRPSERLSQFQEFSQLLQKCQSGDIARITVNSEPYGLGGGWDKERFESPGASRVAKLKDQLGSYFPAEVRTVEKDNVHEVLCKAIALVASEAASVTGLQYHPVLLTTYADGQRMVTATLIALNEAELPPVGLNSWEFTPKHWHDIIDISAPDLSMREKMHIDKCLAKTPNDILEEIGFTIAEEPDDAVRAVVSYQRLHRYYPSFQAIGIQ
jgi:hypothetical protein